MLICSRWLCSVPLGFTSHRQRGPNQFWNNDNKDRALFLVLALAGSLGRHGGNIGSYAGNYKATLFSGIGKWTVEDPFHPQLEPKGEIKSEITRFPMSPCISGPMASG